MFFPDITYGYAPKDLTSVFCELYNREVTETGGFGTIGLILPPIPQDRVFMMSSVTIDAIPGAAQTVDLMRVRGLTSAGQLFSLATARPLLSAAEPAALNWSGQAFVVGSGPGVTTIFALCTFNAGVADNTVTASVSGVVIPRGNIAVF